MKTVNCEQGTTEWLQCRLGVPTASCFGKILTPTGKASAQAVQYRRELIAERDTGAPTAFEPTEWMQRGTELEPDARRWYEFDRDCEVEEVGFVLADDGYGCSPDGMVEGGLVEIKCPKPSTHVGYVLDAKIPTTYKPQVQGQLLVCQREWCDFISYLPGAKPMVIRVERDEDYIKTLHDSLVDFIGVMEDEYRRYKEQAG
jgi:hypothetical protein